MYIERNIENNIINNLSKGKVIIILGARRVGKTKLLESIIKKINEPYIYINGEDIPSTHQIAERSIQKYKELLASTKLLIIDEAQKIDEIGLKLKLMIDHVKNVKIIATGSSSFDLADRTGEPLTGRKFSYELYPIAQSELKNTENLIETSERLESRMIYGSYPEVLLVEDNIERKRYLRELIASYLIKDLLALDKVRNSSKIFNILQLLAFQVGSTVSLNEIAQKVGLDVKTVERYIDLLTKVFVIYKLSGFSRNMRKEITKSSKYFFYDNGIRNAIIDNFHPISLRNDVGQLWENYILMERLKFQSYSGLYSYNYFWRTYDRQEIDLIEDRGGKLYAYEMKYSQNKSRIPAAFKKSYPDASYEIINKNNYLSFIT